MLQKISLLSLACLLFTGCMSNEGTSPEEKKFRKVEAAASKPVCRIKKLWYLS